MLPPWEEDPPDLVARETISYKIGIFLQIWRLNQVWTKCDTSDIILFLLHIIAN